MRSLDTVEALAGRGLSGDRKCRESRGDWGRQVTLIEREAVEAVARESGIALMAGETRRNLVTEGVALNHLVGREFTVGGVRLRGTALCEPCEHLEDVTGKRVLEPLIHRGGLCAQILSDGVVTVGDAIAEVDG